MPSLNRTRRSDRDRLTRLLVVLTGGAAFRTWRDDLGCSPEQAADDVAWAVRALVMAKRREGHERGSIVHQLRDVRDQDAAHVGGKAAGIGELFAVGARVPDGVVLTTGLSGLTPDERQALLASAGEKLGAGPFAVRSSGVAEDGADRSFAGMFETVLDVPAEALPAAADRVLASADAARAAAYGRSGRRPDWR